MHMLLRLHFNSDLKVHMYTKSKVANKLSFARGILLNQNCCEVIVYVLMSAFDQGL